MLEGVSPSHDTIAVKEVGTVSVDTKGEGASPSHGRDLFEIVIHKNVFSCIKILKFT